MSLQHNGKSIWKWYILIPYVFIMWLLLTHWGRVTHICVVKLIIIGSDNGLSPRRRQVIIWTNAGILFIGPLGTNFIEILIGIQTFSFKKMHFKMSSAKWRPFCLGLHRCSRSHKSYHLKIIPRDLVTDSILPPFPKLYAKHIHHLA